MNAANRRPARRRGRMRERRRWHGGAGAPGGVRRARGGLLGSV